MRGHHSIVSLLSNMACGYMVNDTATMWLAGTTVNNTPDMIHDMICIHSMKAMPFCAKPIYKVYKSSNGISISDYNVHRM